MDSGFNLTFIRTRMEALEAKSSASYFCVFSVILSTFHCILLGKLAELASAVCALLAATGRCDARKVLRSLEWHDAGRRDAQIGRRHVCLAGGRKNHERRREKSTLLPTAEQLLNESNGKRFCIQERCWSNWKRPT